MQKVDLETHSGSINFQAKIYIRMSKDVRQTFQFDSIETAVVHVKHFFFLLLNYSQYGRRH
jgi:hypothetical protein